MSSINSFLNAIVLAGLCVAAYFIFSAPKDFGPPPNDVWFQSAVIQQSQPVLVKFGAPWCGPCRMMESVLDQFAASCGGQVVVVRIDVDQHPDISQHYGVSGIPHMFLFHHGKVVADRVGYVDEQELQRWVSSYAGN